MTITKPPSLKILMLHGFTNTGAIFRAKTRALEKSIQKAFPQSTLLYLDGPHRLKPSDIPFYPGAAVDARLQEADEEAEIDSFAWWRRKDPPEGSGEPVYYAGFDEGVAAIANAVRAHGPFDGVVGFSQGACAAAVTASLLEGRRRASAMDAAAEAEKYKMPYPKSMLAAAAATGSGDGDGSSGGADGFVQAPLKFAVVYSGFHAPPDIYGAVYEPKITTPSLHVVGSLDTIVDEDRSRALADKFEDATILVHPGGHFCPSTKDHLEAVVNFMKAKTDASSDSGGPARGLGDERVEDMDMPF